ncbi:MAG TPA: hypothetical protein VK934_10760 [Fimbriimonas sp.]|nr:hypothetical protein [Fimbriimonas sp.]
MTTVQLTKLETALDQVRKQYPKLVPADAALLATALSLTGRHALAIYDGAQFSWPEDYEKLTRSMIGQVEQVNEAIEHNAPKRAAKSTTEEEPVTISVGLAPNLSAGEKLLEGRDDLKTRLSDILQEGVEFSYSPSDIGWQWALDRANWATISGGDVSRRIKIKTGFTEGAVGIEVGTAPKKRATKKVAAAEAPAEDEIVAEEA